MERPRNSIRTHPATAPTPFSLPCLDKGHFYPNEGVADKLSPRVHSVSVLLLRVSLPMRWDSDQVILLGNDIHAVANELVSDDLLPRSDFGLDFFSASISRTTPWILRRHKLQKALLTSLFIPFARLSGAAEKLDFKTRLVMTEELIRLLVSVDWNEMCARMEAPVGRALIEQMDGCRASAAGRSWRNDDRQSFCINRAKTSSPASLQ